MTIPSERTRALVWAGGFLLELASDESLPLPVRQRAVAIARHFPTIEQLSAMAHLLQGKYSFGLIDPRDSAISEGDCPAGPLRDSTRFQWPEQ